MQSKQFYLQEQSIIFYDDIEGETFVKFTKTAGMLFELLPHSETMIW